MRRATEMRLPFDETARRRELHHSSDSTSTRDITTDINSNTIIQIVFHSITLLQSTVQLYPKPFTIDSNQALCISFLDSS
jgi:hypothetical protein